MKINCAKRICALLLTVLMIFTSVPMGVFAQEAVSTTVNTDLELSDVFESQNEQGEDTAVPDGEDTAPLNVASAQELENAINSGAQNICITADFEIDRTFFITKNVSIYTLEAHTLTRKSDFAGDIFVIGESAEGAVCDENVTLSIGTAGAQSSDMLTIDGNKAKMTVAVTGTVFFVCKNGQADLHPDLTVTNCEKKGNVRALDKDKYTLCGTRTIIGGAVGIVAEADKDDPDTVSDGVINVYGGKYTYNGVAESGLYGGAFFNHGKLNVYDGVFEYNYAERAGVFYNYRRMNIYKATVSNNESTKIGGAIYLPASSGAILYVGGDSKTEEVQVTFKNNKSDVGGAISSSGTLVLRNTLFEANTSNGAAGAVYGTGKYDNITVYDCEFRLNKAENGGAVFVKDQRTSGKVELHIRDSKFTENEAAADGGAVYVSDSARAYARDTVFSKNTSASDGGAVYVFGAAAEFNYVSFSGNSSKANGGALYMIKDTETAEQEDGTEITVDIPANVIFNEVTATGNSASKGGVAYGEASNIKAYNSRFTGNNAVNGGSAFYLYTNAEGDFYNCVTEGNVCSDSCTGNAGAFFIYTGGTKVTLNSCSFKDNATKGFGGALLISGKSLVDMFNITATGNSALKGGFMYETAAGTVVSVSGLTVSGNTASAGGPIIWGNTTNAKLYINKNNYTDKDTETALDEAYWSAAIYNKLTVYDSDAQVPSHDEYDQPEFDTKGLSDVKTSRQLELALKEGFESIRILKDFEIDRTYYVTKSTEIYSETPVTLTRKADFAGDIFVVGEDEDAVPTVEEVTLNLGKSASEEENMLVIDGNADNMQVDVEGTAIFLCSKGNANLYKNLTVTNCKKVANKRTNNEAHGVSYPKYVGGAVAILAKDSVMNIYGGTYSANSSNEKGNSVYGGAFYNFGTMKVYDGTFSANSSYRAGVFYNYRKLYIYKATIENNSASIGGAIYVPASTGAFLYIGTDDEAIESEVRFASNSASGNGGAIYCAGRMEIRDAEFESNSASKGGAIYGSGNYKTILVKDSAFSKNTSSEEGSAVWLDGQSTYADRFELNIYNSSFSQNEAGTKGAVYLEETRAYLTNSSFDSNTSASDGAAIHFTTSKADINSVTFNKNSSSDGGALSVNNSSEIEANGITATENTSSANGGFAIVTDSAVSVYNSIFKNNSSASGGAFALGTGVAAKIYNTAFENNEAISGNGGALDIYTANTEGLLHSCTFTGNKASGFGGALRVASGTSLTMYNTTVSGNSANNGGFMCEADDGTTVNLIGAALLGNTAVNGPVVWGTTENAVLNISKKNYVDSDLQTEPDDAYWSGAFANELTVNFIDGDVPPYADYGNEEPGGMWNAVDVASADELQTAIEKGEKEIRITESFEIDRTYYITSDTVIFSTAYVTLRRKSDFGGDMFVVGQYADGTVCEEQADLTVGIPTSETEGLLTIDGNMNDMSAEVKGTVFFVCANGHVNLYDNLTVKNCKKTGNERTLEAVHGVSYPEYIGSAVGIIAKNATMDIYGGLYTGNSGNESGKSSYGGAFYNFGTMNVYGGTFSKNRAARAGAIYNYRKLNIYSADFVSNYSASNGGAIYMPASTGSFLYIGEEIEGTESKVTFTSNSSAGNAGAIYAYNVISIKNTVFEKNKADNGGAIASYSATLTVENSSFNSNKAGVSGGALYISGKSAKENAAELNASDTTFTSNSATLNGGALCIVSGSEAITDGCTFASNTAMADTKEARYGGGAVYVKEAGAELNETDFVSNSSEYNGGAVVLDSAVNAVFKNVTSDGDKAEKDGGFLYSTASSPKIYDSEIKNCTAGDKGGAAALENASVTDIIKTVFLSCSAGSDGGAVFVNTGDGNTLIHSSDFTENTALNGGAIKVTGGSQLELYNAKAEKNSADYGGVVYLSGDETKAKLNLVNVSGNTAKVAGPIVYSDTAGAVLDINKARFTDSDVSGEPDEAYWSSALAGELTVTENNNQTPGYAQYGNESYGYLWTAKDAATADELEKLLADGVSYIRVVADFELDRTFTVKNDTVIFSTKPYKLTRASDFGGVIFDVVSEEGKTTVFTLGNSTSETENLLVIDGNKDKMTASVTGSAINVQKGSKLQIYKNITVTSFGFTPLSVDGEITVYGGSFTNNSCASDGAVLLSKGVAEINGGTFSGNSSSANGGVIANLGTATINGGTFSSGSALNGGVVYNEGSLHIRGGSFEKNTAENGAAVYNKGSLDVYEADFRSNTASQNGGAIMSEKDVTVSGARFESNRSVNGGAVYITSAKELTNSLICHSATFKNNTADNGGAIFAEKVKLTVTAAFEGNSADNGGAVYMAKGCDGDFADIKANSDSAKVNGGFLYCDASAVSFLGGKIEAAASKKNGGAVYSAAESTVSVDSTEFKSNTAQVNGGAIYLADGALLTRINKASFNGNSAVNCGGAVYKENKAQLEVIGSAFESNRSLNGGAVYASSGETVINNSSFKADSAEGNGGALAFERNAQAELKGIDAQKNSAGNNGGFLYSEDAVITLADSTVKTNTAQKSGGAMMLEGDTKAECTDCEFNGNTANTNGGAVSVETDRTKVIFSGCKFISNKAVKNGGAAYIASGSIAELYGITATKNSASYGAVLYETSSSTDVTVDGLTVSGNNAGKDGYIIYGNSSRAVLRINKKNYTDKDKSGTLDSKYWSEAIAGTLKVKSVNEAEPEYGNKAVDVSTAAELEKAIKANKKQIRITADFKIDRTYYITSDITIFSDAPHTLRRDEKFGGDMFVVGENSKGEKAFFDSRVVKLTVGNPLSEKENLLTIDGNKDNMKVQVNGSVFFVTYGANVELNRNLTVVNCYKQGNERAHTAAYKLSRPNRVGGAVAIIANGMLTVNGGNYKYNKVNEEDATTEEGRNSSIGGVFYNASNLIIRGGNFEYNEAARGGIVYNYKIVKIIAGTFKNNVGTKYSAIYYSPSSPGIHLLIGNTDKDGDKVLIKNNRAAIGAGVIYSSHFSAVVIYGNTTFKNNTVTKGNGGVISITGALTVKNTEFIGNTSSDYGGAIHLSRANSDEITRLMHFEGCVFKENQSKYGGAISMSSSAVKDYSKGSIATVKDCKFENNYSKSSGGAIYTTNLSDLTLENNSFTKNRSDGEAGALYFIGKSSIKMNGNNFDSNSAASHGGAMTVRSCYVDLNGDKFIGNQAVKNGGAIYIAYSSAADINSHLTVNGTLFKNNSAAAGGAWYATRRAIEEKSVLVNVKSSTFEENKSKGTGGAILLTAGIITYFKDVTFKKNNAVTGGGAVQLGSKSLFEVDEGSFIGNTSKQGGAITLSSSGTAIMNNITATENASTSNGGFLYSEGGILKLYDSKISKNSGFSGGAMYLYTDAESSIYNTEFESNNTLKSSDGSAGNGGALFIYTGKKDTLIHSCSFDKNESSGSGGAMYISGVSQVKLYKNTASNNKAVKGGFIYETKAGTVVDVIGLTVTDNKAENGGSIIWGNTNNAVMNIDKSKYVDTKVSKPDDNYWATAIEGLLKVNNISKTAADYDSYVGKKEESEKPSAKKPVSVEDVFTLAKKSSDADIDEKYNKLKKLDNSSNLMSRSTADYPNINGKTVTVDTFVYQTKGKAHNGIVGLGILLYQSLCYKKAYPDKEVHINISSYRFSVQSAVNINRNSRYFGYMRNLVGKNYDEYGFVRLSYLLITAAKMGIHVTVIGQQDAYPISSSNPNFYEYFTQQLSDPCDPDYVKNGVIGDYLDFNFCYWTLDAKGGTDMMHTKMCTVSHYLDMNGVVRKNAVWSSSSNLDGVKPDGQNANWKLQTATVVTNHKQLYRTAYNYLNLIASLCGQEQVIEFQDTVNARSTEQIALINQGRGDEIPADEQIVYIGTPKDDVFELYFTPFGGSAVAWDEVHNPYCKYLREMYESEDYILFAWNAAEYSGRFVLGAQIEDMIIRSFHENRNVKNKIYSYMESFDPTTFDDLVVGKDIGYKSFFEKPFGKVHNKDVQLSYVKNGQRYFVTLLNSLNLHSGSMSYQSNFLMVVKEKSCAENGVFSTIARYSTTGDIAAHTYGEEIKICEATKKQDGYTYRECIYCKQKEIIEVVHNAVWTVEKKATEKKDGLRYKKCTVCDKVLDKETIKSKNLAIDLATLYGRTFTAKTPISVGDELTPLTIEARVQIPKKYAGRAGVIVGNYSKSGKSIVNLEAEENGKLKLYIRNGDKVFKHIFSKDIRSDEPVDIAIVFSSSKAILYVGGKKQESVKLNISLPYALSELKVGGDNRSGNTQYFKGIIYSVNLFSKTRSASLIKKDMLIVSPNTPTLIYSGYYKGEKHPATAQLSSQTFTAKKLNKLDKKLSAAPKTIEATISLPTSVKGNGGVIFGNYDEGIKAPLNLEIYTKGRVRLYFKNGKTTVSHIFKTDVRTDSGTVNIAVTLADKTATLYVNGVKKETAKLAVSAPSATKNFCIGGDNRKNNELYFKGKIYSVNVFSDVRTASEIKRDAVAVPYNESKLILSSYVSAGAKNEKVTLKGQTFSKDVRYAIPFDFKSAPKTIEATIQLSENVKGKAGVIFGNYTGKTGDQLNLSVVENGRIKLYFMSDGKTVQHTFKTDIRTKKAAVNIAVTINGKKVTLFVDGIKKETATLSKKVPKITKDFCIGGDNRKGNSLYFKGKIYAVNVFSDVRTDAEIKKDAVVVTDKAKSLLYSGYFYSEKCEITSSAKTHNPSSWKAINSASDSECGVRYTECISCGKVLDVKADEHKHDYTAKTTKKATLTENGSVVTACSICGLKKETKTVYYPKTIKLSTKTYTYNGKVKTPSVTVKDSKGNKLKKGTDYTVKYASGRKSIGKYSVTVTFKGKYSGKKKLYFNIVLGSTSKVTVSPSTTSIKASWNKVTGADGYKVELLSSKGKVISTKTTTKLKYTFKKLSEVTKYKIRVTSYKTVNGKKLYSASTVITTSTAPAAVTLSKVTAGSKQATVTWKTVSGASGYKVQYSTSSKLKNAKTATVKKGSSKKTTIKKLTKGKTYYFRVRAYKTVDGKKIYGNWSTVKSAKIK